MPNCLFNYLHVEQSHINILNAHLAHKTGAIADCNEYTPYPGFVTGNKNT